MNSCGGYFKKVYLRKLQPFKLSLIPLLLYARSERTTRNQLSKEEQRTSFAFGDNASFPRPFLMLQGQENAQAFDSKIWLNCEHSFWR